MKTKVKKLSKPIKTLIKIRVRKYISKEYCRYGVWYGGYPNSGFSARVLVNGDWSTELVYPFKHDCYEVEKILADIQKQFRLRIAPYKMYDGTMTKGNILQDYSILVVEEIKEAKKSEAVHFGKR